MFDEESGVVYKIRPEDPVVVYKNGGAVLVSILKTKKPLTN